MNGRHPRGSRASHIIWPALTALAINAITPATAFAYIDPLSGSLVLQALIAGVLGAAMSVGRVGAVMRETLARVWRRLTG